MSQGRTRRHSSQFQLPIGTMRAISANFVSVNWRMELYLSSITVLVFIEMKQKIYFFEKRNSKWPTQKTSFSSSALWPLICIVSFFLKHSVLLYHQTLLLFKNILQLQVYILGTYLWEIIPPHFDVLRSQKKDTEWRKV